MPAALAQDVGAVFAFPLQGLAPQTLTEAHAFAEVAIELLHSDPTAPLTAEARPPEAPAAEREQVHRAVGMLAVRLGAARGVPAVAAPGADPRAVAA